jgi:16S rRNA (uracil1498-N3)-methyltransferase
MELSHSFWMEDKGLLHQWTRVLRFEVGRELVLFNVNHEEKLYKIIEISKNAIRLEFITEMKPKLPATKLYLCFSLLKKDKNDWILQKATELGVSHFIPLLCDRTEKTGFSVERAEKIVIEAAEQCGRVDIPRLREPITPKKVVEELSENTEIFIAEQGSPHDLIVKSEASQKGIAILIGPEGGWTDEEKQLFIDKNIKHLALSEFTLRAETAAITAAALLQ